MLALKTNGVTVNVGLDKIHWKENLYTVNVYVEKCCVKS